MSLRLINLDVTNKCNLNCAHCGAAGSTCEHDLSLEQVYNLLAQMVQLNCYEMILAGGEPFCRPDIMDILTRASEHRIYTAILTNGTMIDEDKVVGLSQLPYLTYVRISMEAVGAELDSLRGKQGITEDIKAAIRLLKAQNITVGINMAIGPQNIHQLKEVLDFALEQKVNFVRFAPLELVGRSKEEVIDEAFYIDAMNRILTMMGDYSNYLNQELAPLPVQSNQLSGCFLTGCPAGYFSFSIESNGDVNLCPFIQEESNLNIKHSSLAEIWKELQRRKIEYRSVPKAGACSDCAYVASCAGGCMATKTSRNLQISAEQPVCYSRVLELVLDQVYSDPKIRKVLSGVLYRQSVFVNNNIAPCHRSLPFWMYPLKAEIS